ncbi:MAG TPA: hypothetical protein ENJ78_00110, partial [candidate division WWE3 bacterium]|nr:hypothetical protein [candidate division WWE3 bacterium]
MPLTFFKKLSNLLVMPSKPKKDNLKKAGLSFSKGLKPKKILVDSPYTWFNFSEEQTGLTEVCLINENTGFIVSSPFANLKKRTASHMAWAGARHSRAPGMSWEILAEMGEKGVDPDKKLETTFVNYGHASVADMANIMLHIEEIPMHLAMAIFNDHALNGGQEKSTRYQVKFLKIDAQTPLKRHGIKDKKAEDLYKHIINQAEILTNKYYKRIESEFRKLFKPKDKREESSLVARTLDTARMFMPLGLKTGMSINTSAREWSRFIGNLKASPIKEYQELGEQLQHFLTPTKEVEKALNFKAEAPSLIRHTEPSKTAQENLKDLKEYLQKHFHKKVKSFEKKTKKKIKEKKQSIEYFNVKNENTFLNILVAQHINLLYPYLDFKEAVKFIKSLNKTAKKEIVNIIFKNHNRFKQIPIFDDVGPFT